MVTGTVTTFEASLDRLDVGWTHTSPDEFDSVLSEVCDDPVVGVSLPFESLDLPSWVNTRPTPADLREARTGVTAAGIAIADYGSVVIQATPDGAEPVSLFGDTHIAVVRESDILPDMPAAFSWLAEEFQSTPSSAIIATGPSATADMGELVRGAHGPKDVHVVILDE
ncbi:LUD domain-containing protein [Haloferax namakaokahaiae]|uniref:LUD domain-containing protein n=1 Tax=Haloferax namakaokahaiae TaxID=1748331 RepID=A0ABD5ZDL1_9EURY